MLATCHHLYSLHNLFAPMCMSVWQFDWMRWWCNRPTINHLAHSFIYARDRHDDLNCTCKDPWSLVYGKYSFCYSANTCYHFDSSNMGTAHSSVPLIRLFYSCWRMNSRGQIVLLEKHNASIVYASGEYAKGLCLCLNWNRPNRFIDTKCRQCGQSRRYSATF